MNSLLINEQPMVFQPSLAKEIGLQEAVVLQQVQYWCNVNKKNGAAQQHQHEDEDGVVRWWTYNTAAEWAENFPWWSESTVRKYLARLRERGLLKAAHLAPDKRDRTLWYAVCEEAVSALTGGENASAGDSADGGAEDQADPSAGDSADVYKDTKTSTETSTEEVHMGGQEESVSEPEASESKEDPDYTSPLDVPVDEGDWQRQFAQAAFGYFQNAGLISSVIERKASRDPVGLLDDWADTFRLLVEQDGYDPEEDIVPALAWLFNSENKWIKNGWLCSVSTLRKKTRAGDRTKFDVIYHQSQRQNDEPTLEERQADNFAKARADLGI